MNGEEKRIYPRAEIRWTISAITAEGTIEGETKNLSTHGAFICCPKPLCPDERFLMTVKGPSGHLEVVAQVVWSNICACDDEQRPSGMGVRFIWHWPEMLVGWMGRNRNNLRNNFTLSSHSRPAFRTSDLGINTGNF
jgi:hypothetical protein